jgi:type II restriction enzyme
MNTLSKKTIDKIEKTIEQALLTKMESYSPETKNMPFHYRLLGKDRMALFSFIHSINTTFGISIFEPISEIVAKQKFAQVKHQYILGNSISEEAQSEIQHIINDLSFGKNPDKIEEIKRIRKVAKTRNVNSLKTVKVDLFVKDFNGEIFLFDLKTAKPNISNFKDFKRTLLEWVAIYLFNNPDAEIHSYIAIPYNPYAPKPYERWTLKGMFDLKEELLVGEEFWDFLGGKGTYNNLLNCFERVGIRIRPKIDAYFKKFK